MKYNGCPWKMFYTIRVPPRKSSFDHIMCKKYLQCKILIPIPKMYWYIIGPNLSIRYLDIVYTYILYYNVYIHRSGWITLLRYNWITNALCNLWIINDILYGLFTKKKMLLHYRDLPLRVLLQYSIPLIREDKYIFFLNELQVKFSLQMTFF